MNKPPITTLEELLEDSRKCSPLVFGQAVQDFLRDDLERTIQGINQMVMDYEARLKLRDDEIKDLESHLKGANTAA